MICSGGLLTLVIPTYNQCEELRKCLRSIEAHAPDVPVMVVDDGSTDGTREMLATHYPSVRQLTLEKNHGPAFARNRALEVAETPYVAFPDSDAEMCPGWLDGVIPNVAPDTILAGRVDRPDGSLEYGPRKTRFWGGSTPCAEREANLASSNNMVVPVELARAIGGFSEELGIYFEDSYFCICARRAGYRVRYLDAVRVVHHHYSMSNPDHRAHHRNRAYTMVRDAGCPYPMAFVQVAVSGADSFVALLRLRPRSAWASVRGVFKGVGDALAYRARAAG